MPPPLLNRRDGDGETLVQMFLPMIPYYIIVNSSLELLVIPGLLYLGWRAGKRRILIAAERQQAFVDLQLDDPRWILDLLIFAIFMLAAHFSRVRELSH